MSEILSSLNEAQREAVTSTEGCVRVIAGAGSGKTRALTHRFAYLVTELGVLPSNILCVTFTNKAAAEMRRRIRQLTGDEDTGLICTFHSFCVTVLSEEAHAVGYPESFLVLDNSDIDTMLAAIYEERNLSLRDMTFSAARDMIEIRKWHDDPEYYRDMIALPLEELRRKYDEARAPRDIIFYGYLWQEKKCFALDYNDLLVYTLHIFDTCPEIGEKWRSRLEYIMIDEFQDIDDPQYRLMRTLCATHKNLFIVGDPDQTVYTWRGASVKFLLDFEKEFSPVKTVFMNENYRSSPEIIGLANSLISKNSNRIPKELIPTRESASLPVYSHQKTSEAEADRIVRRIGELSSAGTPLSDIAILYRAHYVTRQLEETLLKKQIPYTIYSGVQFFDRAEIKDALSYLRMIAFRDDLAFARIVNRPKRNIGRTRMERLREYADQNGCSLFAALESLCEDELFRRTGAAKFIDLVRRFSAAAQGMPVSELLSAVLDESGYEAMLRTEGASDRLDNLAELKQSIYTYETTCGEETDLESYMRHVALFTNTDTLPSADGVKLMTVHAAKGLEFPHVFLASMEEGVFPSKKVRDREGMEEERRLAFVAVTRAKDSLFISDSEGKNFDGSFRFPSRFVLDVEKSRLTYENELPESLRAKAKSFIGDEEKLASSAEAPPFSKGDRVVHPVFGAGLITGTDNALRAYVILFDSLTSERKISFKMKLTRE